MSKTRSKQNNKTNVMFSFTFTDFDKLVRKNAESEYSKWACKAWQMSLPVNASEPRGPHQHNMYSFCNIKFHSIH